MIWVVDASIAVRWFLAEEADAAADEVLRKMIDAPGIFAVPELFAFEVLAVLCRTHPKGLAVFAEGVIPIMAAGVLRHPMTERLAADIAPFVMAGLTACDACYAGLAQELGGVWLTYDGKAHRRIRRYGVSHLLAEGLPTGWEPAS
jgi:predicted nucleic acid-binding protein